MNGQDDTPAERDGAGETATESTEPPAPDPIVRRATAADERRLRAIQTATLAEPWPDLLSAGVEGVPLVLVLETDEPVGYALVVPGDEAAYVAEFAIAPGRQGRGLGTRLMRALLDRLVGRGFDAVRLTVRRDDDRARGFYETVGFTRLERLPGHYEDADGLLLARELGDGDANGD